MHRNHTRQAIETGGGKGPCRWSDARPRATPRTHEDTSEWIAAFFAVSEVHRSRAIVPLANVCTAAACATDALVPCCPASSVVLETAARHVKRRFLAPWPEEGELDPQLSTTRVLLLLPARRRARPRAQVFTQVSLMVGTWAVLMHGVSPVRPGHGRLE